MLLSQPVQEMVWGGSGATKLLWGGQEMGCVRLAVIHRV